MSIFKSVLNLFKRPSVASNSTGHRPSRYPEVVEISIRSLKNTNPSTRKWAAIDLAEIGPEAKEAEPALIEVLNNDSNLDVRRIAAYALGRIKPELREAELVLVKTLEDINPGVRRMAAFALGRMGGKATSSIPALLETLQDDDDSAVRLQAAKALEVIRNEN